MRHGRMNSATGCRRGLSECACTFFPHPRKTAIPPVPTPPQELSGKHKACHRKVPKDSHIRHLAPHRKNGSLPSPFGIALPDGTRNAHPGNSCRPQSAKALRPTKPPTNARHGLGTRKKDCPIHPREEGGTNGSWKVHAKKGRPAYKSITVPSGRAKSC